jgi:hypothetical protein
LCLFFENLEKLLGLLLTFLVFHGYPLSFVRYFLQLSFEILFICFTLVLSCLFGYSFFITDTKLNS